MKKNFILIILLLFIFINKVKAIERTVMFADFSKNEIMLSEENYLIVGNIESDFNSIKHFADKYCSNKLGDKYMSSSIQINTSVAYAYCRKIDELNQFNLTEIERSCFRRLDLFLDILYNRECSKIKIDFESILTEVKKYREKINVLSSDAFIYGILSEDISKKILNFETKNLSSFDNIIINRNMNLCKLYGFVERSEFYFKCILSLLRKHIPNDVVNIDQMDFN